MSHYQNQYGAGAVPQTDEYGNPIRQTDEAGYGSYQTGHTTGGLGTGTGVATGHNDRGLHGHEHGHEKKGVVDKIKEKLPGVRHKGDRPQYTGSTTTPGGYGGHGMSSEGQYQQEHGHEKKGMVDKIKEKVPCVGHIDDRPQYTGSTTTPGGYGGQGMSGEGQYQHGHGHEKKGVVDKIKEKLPGQHHHGH